MLEDIYFSIVHCGKIINKIKMNAHSFITGILNKFQCIPSMKPLKKDKLKLQQLNYRHFHNILLTDKYKFQKSIKNIVLIWFNRKKIFFVYYLFS